MKMAINGQMLARAHALPDALQIVKNYGLNAMEIWPQNLAGGATPEEKERYETKDVAAAQAAYAQAGMQCACVTLGFNALRVCTASGGVANATDALVGAVDTAARLGASVVNCYLAHMPAPLFVEAMKPAARHAASKDVVIVLENEAHDGSGLALDVLALMEAVGSDHFRTQYDPCNYYHAYEEPYPYAYEILKERIGYVHMKGGTHWNARWDSFKGGLMRGRRDAWIGYVALPDAAFNAERILQRLREDGYAGYVTLEPHVPAQALRDIFDIEVPYLKRHLAGIGCC